MGEPVPKAVDIFFEFLRNTTSHEERELSQSHPQFPCTTLERPKTMTSHLATKYDDNVDDDHEDEQLEFLGLSKK